MVGDTLFRPKKNGRDIMVSEFLLLFACLGLSHLSRIQQEEIMCNTGLKTNEAVEVLEYRKNNDSYLDWVKLLRQVMEKALPIAETLYFGYSILFMLDNTTSHLVYTKHALCTNKMKQKLGNKQVIFYNSWYIDQMGMYHIQPMWYLGSKRKQIPKEIQKVFTKRGLWPATGLNLECPKPKCYNCQMMADFNLCIKGTKCQTCKEKNDHSANCGSGRKCNACVARKENCECVNKQYCIRCSEEKS